jgi:hypothetical protein
LLFFNFSTFKLATVYYKIDGKFEIFDIMPVKLGNRNSKRSLSENNEFDSLNNHHLVNKRNSNGNFRCEEFEDSKLNGIILFVHTCLILIKFLNIFF